MSIAITCPSCGGQLKAPDTAVGKRVRCPKCAKPVTVPAAEEGFEVVDTDDDRSSRRPRKRQVTSRKPLYIGLGCLATFVLILSVVGIAMYNSSVEAARLKKISDDEIKLQIEKYTIESDFDQSNAKNYRATISSIRKIDDLLEIDYEFVAGYPEGRVPHNLGFIFRQNENDIVFDAVMSLVRVEKKAKLRIRTVPRLNADKPFEVWMVSLDDLRKPHLTISNKLAVK